MTTLDEVRQRADERVNTVMAAHDRRFLLQQLDALAADNYRNLANNTELYSSLERVIAERDALLAALRGSKEALVYAAAEIDGWIESLTKSLTYPDFGIALSDQEKFLRDSREELEERKRHAATIRALLTLAGE